MAEQNSNSNAGKNYENLSAEELKAQIERLTFIQQIGSQFASTLNLPVLLDNVLKEVIKILDAEAGSIWLNDPSRKEIACYIAHGPTKNKVQNLRLKEGQGIVGSVAKEKNAKLVSDVRNDPDFSGAVDQSSGFVTRSMICSPILAKGESLGSIQVINKADPNALFYGDDLDLLNILAVNAGIAIKNAQLYYAEKKAKELSAIIQKIGSQFSSTLNLPTLLDSVLKEIIKILEAEAGSIWLNDPVRKEIACYIAAGPTKDKVQNLRLKEGQGIVGTVAKEKKAKIVSDVSRDPNFSGAVDKSSGFVTRSMICSPIIAKGESLGSIQVINKVNPNALFQNDDLELLNVLSTTAGISIKNAQLYAIEKKAKELSAILDISKEITSTLDLQQVLFTIVNLASKVIQYDRCAIALEHKGVFELNAVSGVEELDAEKYPLLSGILSWSGNTGREVWIRESESFLKGNEVPDEFRQYFESEEMKAVWLVPLKDEEGVLGVLCVEGKAPHFIADAKFQMLRILVNQTTVAIRNAQLYSSVPMGNVFNKVLAGKGSVIRGSKRKWMFRLAAAVIVLALLSIPAPYRVGGSASVHPVKTATIYSKVSGTVKSIPENVKEGIKIKTGDLIAVIDDTKYRLQKINLSAQQKQLEKSLPRLQSGQNIAEFKQSKLKLEQVKADIDLLDYQLNHCEIRSTLDGIISTSDFSTKEGSLLSPGSPFCEISDIKKVIVDISIPEEELSRIKSGSEVGMKVKSYPLLTFNGLIISVSQDAEMISGKAFYKVRAEFENPRRSGSEYEYMLKSGMTGRAKIEAASRPYGSRIFGGLIDYIYFKFWL